MSEQEQSLLFPKYKCLYNLACLFSRYMYMCFKIVLSLFQFLISISSYLAGTHRPSRRPHRPPEGHRRIVIFGWNRRRRESRHCGGPFRWRRPLRCGLRGQLHRRRGPLGGGTTPRPRPGMHDSVEHIAHSFIPSVLIGKVYSPKGWLDKGK